MFGSAILDVAIGLILIFIVFAVASAGVTEQISQFLRLRSENLWESVCALVGDRDGTKIAADIFEHQLVQGLAVEQGKPNTVLAVHPADRPMPAYIPANVFAAALMDCLIQHVKDVPETTPITVATLSTATFDDGVPKDLLESLRQFIQRSENNAAKLEQSLADWYDAGMARASGWYKRKTSTVLFLVALGITLLANADTFMIANELMAAPNLRAALVAQESKPQISAVQASVLPLLGWVKPGFANPQDQIRQFPSGDFGGIVMKIFGLLVTAYAATLGAPFWFKALQQATNIRNAVTGKQDPS